MSSPYGKVSIRLWTKSLLPAVLFDDSVGVKGAVVVLAFIDMTYPFDDYSLESDATDLIVP